MQGRNSQIVRPENWKYSFYFTKNINIRVWTSVRHSSGNDQRSVRTKGRLLKRRSSIGQGMIKSHCHKLYLPVQSYAQLNSKNPCGMKSWLMNNVCDWNVDFLRYHPWWGRTSTSARSPPASSGSLLYQFSTTCETSPSKFKCSLAIRVRLTPFLSLLYLCFNASDPKYSGTYSSHPNW